MLKPLSFDKEGGVNVPSDVIMAQVAANIRRQLPQLQPHSLNPTVALLVCGGPSLNETEGELVEAFWRGGRIVSVNGSYDWCIAHNLKPSATVMLDAREFNARFVERKVPDCHYLISSQCHPKVFDICAGRQVTIWHTCSGGDEEFEMLKKYYFGRTHPITLGTTVAIRALSLLQVLGFTRVEVFGFDSCWYGEKHHAYDQAENDTDRRIPVTLRASQGEKHREEMDTQFVCAPWHVRQCEDFMQFSAERSEAMQLNVHGKGLIATAIKTGYRLSQEHLADNVATNA